jgi:hypothetical protein
MNHSSAVYRTEAVAVLALASLGDSSQTNLFLFVEMKAKALTATVAFLQAFSQQLTKMSLKC